MSLQSLTTTMRGASAEYNNYILIDTAIQAELGELNNLRNDIITHICSPGSRSMEEVISAWQGDLNVGQSDDPNAPGFREFEWRSPITHGTLSDTSYTHGSVNIASSTIDSWKIEQWTLWKFVGSVWTAITPVYNNNFESYDTLTDSKLSSLGLTHTKSSLQQYIDQWSFGMEWLHAAPISDGSNPYSGSFRGFGVDQLISQTSNNLNTQAATTDFLLRKSTVQLLP